MALAAKPFFFAAPPFMGLESSQPLTQKKILLAFF